MAKKKKAKVAAKTQAAVEPTPVVTAAQPGLTMPAKTAKGDMTNPKSKGLSSEPRPEGSGWFTTPEVKQAQADWDANNAIAEDGRAYKLIPDPSGKSNEKAIGWRVLMDGNKITGYRAIPLDQPEKLWGDGSSNIIGGEKYTGMVANADGTAIGSVPVTNAAGNPDIANMSLSALRDWIGEKNFTGESVMQFLYIQSAMLAAREAQAQAKTYQDWLMKNEDLKTGKSLELIDTEIQAANTANEKAGALWEDYYGVPKRNADGSVVRDAKGNVVMQKQGIYRPKQIAFIEESFRGVSPEAEAARAGLTIQREADKGVAEAKRTMTGLGIDPSSARAQEVLARSYGPALAAAKAGAMTTARDRALATNFAKKQAAVGLITGMPSESATIGAQGKVAGGTGLLGSTGGGVSSAGGLALDASRGVGSAAGLGSSAMSSVLSDRAALERASKADDGGSFGLKLPGGFGFEVGGL